MRPAVEGSHLHKRFDRLLVFVPRIEGERVIPVIQIGRKGVEPFGGPDPCERLLPPPPIDQNICKNSGNIGIVRIELECAVEMDFGFVVLLQQKQQLREDAVRPGVTVVEIEGRLDLAKRIIQ